MQSFTALTGRISAEVLDELVRDPKLRAVLLAQRANYGGTTATEMSFGVYALIMGHYFNGACLDEMTVVRASRNITGSALKIWQRLLTPVSPRSRPASNSRPIRQRTGRRSSRPAARWDRLGYLSMVRNRQPREPHLRDMQIRKYRCSSNSYALPGLSDWAALVRLVVRGDQPDRLASGAPSRTPIATARTFKIPVFRKQGDCNQSPPGAQQSPGRLPNHPKSVT